MSPSERPTQQVPLSRRVRELELMVEVTRRLTSTLELNHEPGDEKDIEPHHQYGRPGKDVGENCHVTLL